MNLSLPYLHERQRMKCLSKEALTMNWVVPLGPNNGFDLEECVGEGKHVVVRLPVLPQCIWWPVA